MASSLGSPTSRLSDSVIGRVLPRIPTRHRQTDEMGRHGSNLFPYQEQELQYSETAASEFLAPIDPKAIPHVPVVNSSLSRRESEPTISQKKRQLTAYYRSPVRLKRCRANQARYRARQREYQKQLEKGVEQLRQEVGNSKRKYRNLSSRESSNQSPWSVVVEVFRLVESSFRSPWRTVNAEEMATHKETRQVLAVLEKSFAHDAAMGNLRGVHSLIEQLQRFSQYFAEPHLRLMHVEALATGVMAARAKLSVTVSELSLEHVFVSDEEESTQFLYERLLGRRLEFNCTMNFLFDEGSGRVVRLENKIDLVAGLLQCVGNLEEVLSVLENALVTPECTIGADLTDSTRSP